jgi:transcriptional regulator with GAF, ATPase, and Fis domain
LIESELFGHRRGAFTGALADRAGWMEVCPPAGAVFLDEIGEVDSSIQVKLLRVLQSRAFQPLGGTDTRRFEGKIIAATNRDLPVEIRAGRFREDFYYRLCSDQPNNSGNPCCRPKVLASTSGQRDDPPMPQTITWRKRFRVD